MPAVFPAVARLRRPRRPPPLARPSLPRLAAAALAVPEGRQLCDKKYLTKLWKAGYSSVMTLTRPEGIWSALAIAVGLLAAVLTLHTDDLQYAVLFLFVEGAVFGCARPRRPWQWACLIAVWIPLSQLFNCLVTLPSPRDLGFPARLFLGPLVVFFRATIPVSLAEVPGSCLSLIPVLAGAYAGAWMSRVSASA